VTSLTRADIGRLLTVRNAKEARFTGTISGFNERGDIFMKVSTVNLGERWERLPKTETRCIKGATKI